MKMRVFLIAIGLLVLLWLAASPPRFPRTAPRTATIQSEPPTPQTSEPTAQTRSVPTAPPIEEPSSPAPTPTNHWRLALLGKDGEIPPVSREEIERWIALNHTNADCLLAARQAGAGREFLLAALEKYPNDPRVLFNALTLDDSPEAKRERLERFKTAAPENALPEYLSAREHLKNSQPELALQDLLAAAQKPQFQDYSMDATQNAEELYMAAGKSPAEGKALAAFGVLLPHLAQLKGLAQDMATLQSQYIAAGDTSSAETLAQYGLQLSQQLSTGEGSRYLIDQLVGYAVERIVLKPLDPQKNYDFLQGTVQDRFTDLDAKKAEAKQTSQFLDQWMTTASDSDLVNYFERLKVYGEAGALKWLKQH